MGASITGNDYVPGFLTYERPGQPTLSLEAELRVRGNTSSYGGNKQSYKLKLDQSTDMLGMGSSHADREWQLLNVGSSLNYYVGEYLSGLCGMEWVAHGTLVNVMLNGDWKGIYYLSESVSRGATRGDVSDTGYIFENDAYWWKEDTVSFRVSSQPYGLAFTFKYPDITDEGDQRVADLQAYMEYVTGLVVAVDPAVRGYLDFDTFAAWVMVRDVMHSGDSGGSNMYYYLYDLDTSDYLANKLKMGPVWDFDASMKGSESWYEDVTGWSDQHVAAHTYFAYLFENGEFRAVYLEKWRQVSPELEDGLSQVLEGLCASDGVAIDESRKLDAARWGTDYTSVEEEVAYDEAFVRQRVAWIDDAVADW